MLAAASEWCRCETVAVGLQFFEEHFASSSPGQKLPHKTSNGKGKPMRLTGDRRCRFSGNTDGDTLALLVESLMPDF